MAVKIYKTTAPPPLIAGPLGYIQYTFVVTAATKAEAALLTGLRPGCLAWDKDPGWHPVLALLDAGFLRDPGEVYLAGATKVDHSAIWRRLPDGESWELLGHYKYRGPGRSNPYLDTEA